MSQYCNRYQRAVKNPCIHDSQVKWCKQKAIMTASEVYGAYKTTRDGVVIKKGIGPFEIVQPFAINQDYITFSDEFTSTKVRISSISL